MSLRDLLLAEPNRKLHAAIKCREFEKAVPRLVRTQRPRGLDIELVEVKAAGKGTLQVFFRAWQDGQQIGWGPDGSADIKLNTIHSPRYCVPDPAGPIVKSFLPIEGPHEVAEKRYREDMQEALLLDLAHTIKVKKEKFLGSRNIVRGKISHSTDTFFSGAGDGWAGQVSTNWDTVHDNTAGNEADAVGTFTRVMTGSDGAGTAWIIRRGFFPVFVTGVGTVVSATFSMDTVETNNNNDNDTKDYFVGVGATTQADPTTIGTADYDTCGSVDTPTEWTDHIDWGDIAAPGTYTDWTVNAAGLAAISNDNYWLIGFREGHDVEDDPFTITGGSQANQKRFETSETADTTSDPKLVVEHTAGGSGGSMQSRLLLMGVG